MLRAKLLLPLEQTTMEEIFSLSLEICIQKMSASIQVHPTTPHTFCRRKSRLQA